MRAPPCGSRRFSISAQRSALVAAGAVGLLATVAAAAPPRYPERFEAAGDFEFRVAPVPAVQMIFQNHLELAAAERAVRGPMTSRAAGGAFGTVGGGGGELLFTGRYDPISGRLEGTFRGAGAGQAENAVGSFGGAGTAGGKWWAQLQDFEAREIRGELTWDRYVPGYETWPFVLRGRCRQKLSREEAIAVVKAEPTVRRALQEAKTNGEGAAVYGLKEILRPEVDTIAPLLQKRSTKPGQARSFRCPTWFFVVDLHPDGNFAHRVLFVTVDAGQEAGAAKAEVTEEHWWPVRSGQAIWYSATLRERSDERIEVVAPQCAAPGRSR